MRKNNIDMRILIITNGSSQNNKALKFCAPFVRFAGDSIRLLIAVDNISGKILPSFDSFLEFAQETLGIPNLHTRVRIGQLYKEILNECREGEYDLVIMGDQQVHRSTYFFLKPLTVRLAEVIQCSVLLVVGKINPVRHILLCDSGAGHASTLNRFSSQWVNLLDGGQEITVLHVMSQISAGPGVRGKQLRACTEELIAEHTPEGDLLERDVQLLRDSGFRSTPKVRHGLVVDEILTEAQSGDYDLVVIGAHHFGGWQGLLLDDVAQKIIMRLDRPVLIIK